MLFTNDLIISFVSVIAFEEMCILKDLQHDLHNVLLVSLFNIFFNEKMSRSSKVKIKIYLLTEMTYNNKI